MYKKIFSVILIIALCFTFVSCGNKEATKTKEKPLPSITKEDAVITINNKEAVTDSSNPYLNSYYITLDCNIQNNTNKDIMGIKFNIIVKDIFDDVIEDDYVCSFDSEIIPAKSSIDTTQFWEVNPYVDNEVKIFKTDYDKLKFICKVDKIIYTDGN